MIVKSARICWPGAVSTDHRVGALHLEGCQIALEPTDAARVTGRVNLPQQKNGWVF
jgi:hypothetical protein